MKTLVLFFGALAAYSQQVTISDTLTNAVGGSLYTGRITVTLNSPASAQPLAYGTTSLAGWQYVLCIGVTGSDCSSQTAAGVVLIPLYSNSTITPGGTSYTARYAPAKGSAWSETWVVAPANTKLYEIRSTVVPSPSVTFALSQITASGATPGQYLRWSGSAWAPYTLAPLTDPTTTTGDLIYRSSGGALTRLGIGSSGQVLTVSGGLPSWAAAAGGGAVSSVFGRTGAVTATAGDYTTAQVTESGNLYYTDARARAAITGTAPVSVSAGVVSCSTCVVTSGSYANPAWITSLAGSKISSAVSTASALATARTIAGVSFDGTANIAIPSTGLSDTANLARLNAGQSYSAGARQTFTPSATTAGLNVGVQSSAPSTPAQGDVYFDSTLTRKGVYDGTQWRYELYAPTGTGVMQWSGSVITAGALAYSSLTGTPSLAAIATSGSASDLTSGTVATARLGTGTASSSTYLRGDGTWATPAGGASTTACEIVIGDPGAATPILADDNDAPALCANVSSSTQTITAIACWSNTGTPTVRPIITGGAANSLLSSDLTCGTGSYATGTLNGTPTLAAGATIDANIASAGGVAKYIVIRITRSN